MAQNFSNVGAFSDQNLLWQKSIFFVTVHIYWRVNDHVEIFCHDEVLMTMLKSFVINVICYEKCNFSDKKLSSPKSYSIVVCFLALTYWV